MSDKPCFHCGADCDLSKIIFDDKNFCCNGCKTVYEILNQNELQCYYDLTKNPGTIPKEIKGKFNYLDNQDIVSKLVAFDDGDTIVVEFNIPNMHCSSCIWVLENLHKLNNGIKSSQVDFPKKTVRLTFSVSQISFKTVVELMTSIGYEPNISLEDASSGKKKIDRKLIYQVAVAGFAFGNIMLMSLPEYFQLDEFWLNQYKPFFRAIMFAFAIPVVVFSARDYFISALKGLSHKILNIDVPIALGIGILFIRSTYDIVFNLGQGYFDSLAGLVFFLLLGKVFQQKTYHFLSFERDYKSYFPIAVTIIENDKSESYIPVYDVKKGDRLLIRHQELIPVDSIIINGEALIDYSFVTGESAPITKQSGDKVFAGGKQIGGSIEIAVVQKMSQSYLTQLWGNAVFSKKLTKNIKSLTDAISKNFTIIIIAIAFFGALYWFRINANTAFNVFTAVLIIACPCALALAAPFALGNMLRLFGNSKCYLKQADVIESLSKIDAIVFDKTGTLTTSESKIIYSGLPLSEFDFGAIKSLLRQSNHLLSRKLYDYLKYPAVEKVADFNEIVGGGIKGTINEIEFCLGSAKFVGAIEADAILQTKIWIKINREIRGKFIFENTYRATIQQVFKQLHAHYELIILSGDNEGEKAKLSQLLPLNVQFYFNQKPQQKLDFIKDLQSKGKNVLMIGDGLNDAGALAQSNVGLAVSEDINIFSPACDGILKAEKFGFLPNYLIASKQTLNLIKISFIISFVYNFIGIYLAVQGLLSPIIAAIFMPLSSISVVLFVTFGTNYIFKKLTFVSK